MSSVYRGNESMHYEVGLPLHRVVYRVEYIYLQYSSYLCIQQTKHYMILCSVNLLKYTY